LTRGGSFPCSLHGGEEEGRWEGETDEWGPAVSEREKERGGARACLVWWAALSGLGEEDWRGGGASRPGRGLGRARPRKEGRGVWLGVFLFTFFLSQVLFPKKF